MGAVAPKVEPVDNEVAGGAGPRNRLGTDDNVRPAAIFLQHLVAGDQNDGFTPQGKDAAELLTVTV